MTSTSLQNQTKQCSRCTKPAKSACAGCKQPPVPSLAIKLYSPIYYCSQVCQRAAWSSHQKVCKISNTLYRAADTIQKCFFIYREKTFDIKIVKIEEEDDKLYLTEGIYNDDEIFVQFPENLINNEKDRQAVLTCWTCTEAVFWMQGFVKTILEGFNAHLEEICCELKLNGRSAQIIAIDGHRVYDLSGTFQHELLKITLPTGESFALDITGAQNGNYDSIIPWDKFCKKRLLYIIKSGPIGTRQLFLRDFVARIRTPTDSTKRSSKDLLLTALVHQNSWFMDVLNDGVKFWLEWQGWKNFDPLLNMTSESFDAKQLEFLSFVEADLQNFKEGLIVNGDLGTEYKRVYEQQQQATQDNDPKGTLDGVEKERNSLMDIAEEMVGKLDISKAEKEGEASREVVTESRGNPFSSEVK